MKADAHPRKDNGAEIMPLFLTYWFSVDLFRGSFLFLGKQSPYFSTLGKCSLSAFQRLPQIA
jgi:hypothetical protein